MYYLTKQSLRSAMCTPLSSSALSDVIRCQSCWKALYLHENYLAVCRYVAFNEPRLCRQNNRRQINYNVILRPHIAFGGVLKFSGCLCATLFSDVIFRIPNYVKNIHYCEPLIWTQDKSTGIVSIYFLLNRRYCPIQFDSDLAVPWLS